jgi:hypothetical protein
MKDFFLSDIIIIIGVKKKMKYVSYLPIPIGQIAKLERRNNDYFDLGPMLASCRLVAP